MAAIRSSARAERAAAQIGTQLAAWRKLQGLTAAQVADRAGIARGTLHRLESGEATVGMAVFLNVARALGILDSVVESTDPFATDLGRARSADRLPERVRA